MSRKGKHSPTKKRIEGYYRCEEKALMILVAKTDGLTLTDSLLSNTKSRARQLGILDQAGNISDKYRDEFDLLTKMGAQLK